MNLQYRKFYYFTPNLSFPQTMFNLPSTLTCAVLCEPPAMQRYCPASIPVKP